MDAAHSSNTHQELAVLQRMVVCQKSWVEGDKLPCRFSVQPSAHANCALQQPQRMRQG